MRSQLLHRTFAAAFSLSLLPIHPLLAAALEPGAKKRIDDDRPPMMSAPARGAAAIGALQNAGEMMSDPKEAQAAGGRVFDQAGANKGDAAVGAPALPAFGGGAAGPLLLRSAAPAGPLPRLAEPSRYELRVELEPEADRYAAQGTVFFRMLKKASAVTLHASKDLAIRKVVFLRQGGVRREIPLSQLVFDEVNDRLTIPIGEPYEGEASLYFEVASKFNPKMKGVYLSLDKDLSGRVVRNVGTQFEATDARRLFPSWDEPSYKATMQLSLVTPSWHTSISNMPVQREIMMGEKKMTLFRETPRISSYLWAFFSGRFDFIEGTSKDGVPVRVYGSPERVKKMGKTALAAQLKFVDWGSRYFGVPFLSFLPKHDMIALTDFSSGAMENPGANSFRETALFFDPEQGSASGEERVINVVQHENAHTWFGDLVTMSWWNGLWLNESFARYMQGKPIDIYYPKYDSGKSAEPGKQGAMVIDELKASRPIQVDVNTEAEIRGIFDAITYDKGGAVLKMIDRFVGLDKFRDGVRLYMRAHAYGNAERDDLWKAVAKASGNPRIVEIGSKWVTQAGYPIVTVRPEGGAKLHLSQRRFMAGGETEPGKTWPIPMVLAYQLKGEDKVRAQRVLFDQAEMDVTLKGGGEVLWVNANANQNGYYRTALEGALGEGLLKKGLKKQSAVERLGIVQDLWARTRTGELPAAKYLDSLAQFKGESDRIVLEAMATSLIEIDKTFLRTPREKAVMRAYVKELVGPQWRKLGWPKPGEDHEIARSRAVVLGLIGRFAADGALTKEARRRLDAYLKDPASGDPNLAAPLLMIGARNGDKKLWNDILAAYKKTDVPELKPRLLAGGLAEFADPELARATLKLMFAKEGGLDVVRGQDLPFPLDTMLARPETSDLAYEFLTENWKALVDKASEKGAIRFVGALKATRDPKRLEHMKAFFTDPANRVPDADRAFQQTVELIGHSLKFKAASEASVQEWVTRRGTF